MSDGFIKISTEIDEKPVDKGLASIDKKLKGAEKTTGSASKSFAKMGLAAAGAAAAIKIAADVVGDLTDAYKKQAKAETQLESAAKNNPYLDSSSVQTLKNYASEIQSYSTFGDEELLPMMAKLAAAGRTQDQIMQIMSAATDMAASGAFSLDGAVNNLNKSFGGLSGELGESIPEIKSLTAEQLKNGAAVTLLAGRYKGIAAEVAKTTGSQEQLNNAVGDFKEEVGAGFEKALTPVRQFFTEIISGWASAMRARREYYSDIEKAEKGIANERGANVLASEKLVEYLAAQDEYEAGLAYNSEEVNKQLKERVSILKSQYDQLRAQEIQAREGGRAQAAQAKQNAKTKQDNKELAEYIAANTSARDKALKTLEETARVEERSVTAEERLTVYAQSYVDLVSNSNGLVRAQDAVARNLLKTTREISAEAEKQNDAKEKAAEIETQLREALSQIEAADPRKESEKMYDQLKLLDDYYAKVQASEYTSAEDKAKIEEEYLAKREELLHQEALAVEAENAEEIKSRQEKTTRVLEIANEFAAQYANITASVSGMITQQIKDESDVKIAKLDEQYEKGAISAEEYEKKVNDIKKEAAKEQYKVDMWQWSTNILTAVANTALGISQAIGEGGIFGIALGAIVGAAGAAQLATIIANKPVPPSFATGGIVGGDSYTGDKLQAMVNSGEMILNAGQQRNLFDSINSGNVGARAADIKVYNSASNQVTAKPEVTEDGIKIMIEKTVNYQMSEGRYNNSFKTMQNNIKGTRYTN